MILIVTNPNHERHCDWTLKLFSVFPADKILCSRCSRLQHRCSQGTGALVHGFLESLDQGNRDHRRPQGITNCDWNRHRWWNATICNDIQRYATNTPIWNDSNSQHLWFTVDLLMLNHCTPCLKTRLSPSYGYGIRIGSVGPKRALWTSGDHQEVSDVQFVDWNLPPQQLVRAKTYRTNQIWVCQCHIGNQVQYDLINWWVSRDISHVVKCGEKMLPHSLFHAQEEEFQNAACRTKRTKATPNIPNLFWTFKRTILIAIDCIN